jgi:hypothetical protein
MDIELTGEQAVRLSRANQELLDAINGSGDLRQTAITVVSMINVLVLPPHLAAS